MEGVAPLLAENLTEQFFRTPDASWRAAINNDKGLRPLFASINTLLSLDETVLIPTEAINLSSLTN
jgi:hypothetical protein